MLNSVVMWGNIEKWLSMTNESDFSLVIHRQFKYNWFGECYNKRIKIKASKVNLIQTISLIKYISLNKQIYLNWIYKIFIYNS